MSAIRTYSPKDLGPSPGRRLRRILGFYHRLTKWVADAICSGAVGKNPAYFRWWHRYETMQIFWYARLVALVRKTCLELEYRT